MDSASVVISDDDCRAAYVLVGVPVEARVLEDEPILFPLLSEVAFSVLLLPQPALAVAVAQVLTGDPPPTPAGQRAWGETGARSPQLSTTFIYSTLLLLPAFNIKAKVILQYSHNPVKIMANPLVSLVPRVLKVLGNPLVSLVSTVAYSKSWVLRLSSLCLFSSHLPTLCPIHYTRHTTHCRCICVLIYECITISTTTPSAITPMKEKSLVRFPNFKVR